MRRKYFSLRPQPLEQWIWRQGVSPSAERVFWLHWQEGMRNRDWCSSIALKRVAALCALDVSSVTRAYQALARLGLLRRQDPGRDPSRPFERAVAVTEVRVPRELLQEMGRHPDRRLPANTPVSAGRVAGAQPPMRQPTVSTLPEQACEPFKGMTGRERRRALGELIASLSANERRQYDEALRTHRPHLSFDENTQLDAQGRAKLLQFLQIAASAPLPATTTATAPVSPANPSPRKLSVFELARLRRDLHAQADMTRAGELLREVVWAAEQGALSRFTTLHAVRIALKKIREGAWTRPNRMPPNWSRELAQSDVCRSA